MKSFITWLYKKYVFMPKLRSFKHTKDLYQYMVQHDLDLCDDIGILRKMLEYEDDPSPELRIVR